MDAVAPREGEKNINVAGHTVEEEIATTIGTDSGQGKDNDNSSHGNNNRNGSPGATLPISGQENITSTTNQEPHAADNTITTTNTTTNPSPTHQLYHPTTRATPPTPTPAPRPSTTFAQCRLDIRNYFADLAERERLLGAREKWVTSRAEALWRNAEVLAGVLKRESDGRGRKRVMRGIEEDERGGKRARRL